jgi:Ca-activated chloride channel family protein
MSLRPLIGIGWLLLVLLPALGLAGWLALRAEASVRRRWWLRVAAVVALLGLGLGPSLPRQTEQELGVAVEIFFVVDRTGSMAAEDWGDGAPRLDGVRQDVPALVAAVPGARYSVIAWDSEATRQLPLTTDARAVSAWSQTFQQEITAYSSGSLVDRPLTALTTALQGAAERNPSHVRLVFFLSDGEQTTEGEPASFEALAPLVDGGAVLGYGTTGGGPMRSYDGSLDPVPDAPFILDGSGDDAPPPISVIDEEALRTVADQLGVEYVHREGPDGARSGAGSGGAGSGGTGSTGTEADAELTDLVDDLDAEQVAADGRRTQTTWTAVTWPFAVVLVGLLGAEVWWTVRSWTPLRRDRRGGTGRPGRTDGGVR